LIQQVLFFLQHKNKKSLLINCRYQKSILKTKEDILLNLKRIGDTPVILILNFDTNKNKTGNAISKYLECNNEFVKKLINGINNISLQCPLFTGQISVYQK